MIPESRTPCANAALASGSQCRIRQGRAGMPTMTAEAQNILPLPTPAMRGWLGLRNAPNTLKFRKERDAGLSTVRLRKLVYAMIAASAVGTTVAQTSGPGWSQGGGDHQGQNWVPTPGVEFWGHHHNIGTCDINGTIYVGMPTGGSESNGGKLQIDAKFINVNAMINGSGRGFGGGGPSSARTKPHLL
jgi:hypothetical protein